MFSLQDILNLVAALAAVGGFLAGVIFTYLAQAELRGTTAWSRMFVNPLLFPSRLTNLGRRYRRRALVAFAAVLGGYLLSWCAALIS